MEDEDDITDMIIDSRDVGDEETADEMFKKLGYTKVKRYINAITYYNSYKFYEISFNLNLKIIDMDIYGGGISMQELKAINKKVEELKWI